MDVTCKQLNKVERLFFLFCGVLLFVGTAMFFLSSHELFALINIKYVKFIFLSYALVFVSAVGKFRRDEKSPLLISLRLAFLAIGILSLCESIVGGMYLYDGSLNAFIKFILIKILLGFIFIYYALSKNNIERSDTLN